MRPTSQDMGLTWSPEREPSAHSPDDGEEKEYEEDDEGEDNKGEEVEVGEGEEEEESDELVGQVDGSGSWPFIPPKIWTVNDFYPSMSQKVFNTLCDRHQIPSSIPIHLPGKFERCYSGKTTDVGMYVAMFTTGLRLLLTELHSQLANYLGLFVSQIALNAWRIFIGVEVI